MNFFKVKLKFFISFRIDSNEQTKIIDKQEL